MGPQDANGMENSVDPDETALSEALFAQTFLSENLGSLQYSNDPTFSDRRVLANTVDPDQTEEQSDQGRHCLPFRLNLLDSFLYGTATLFKF